MSGTDSFAFVYANHIHLLQVNIYNLPLFSPILAFLPLKKKKKTTKNLRRPWKH